MSGMRDADRGCLPALEHVGKSSGRNSVAPALSD